MTLGVLQGTTPLEIGHGSKNTSTTKQALKKCAPLARQGWSIYIERLPDEFKYGIFREPESPTALDIRSTLASLPAESIKAIITCQLAERAVELIGTAERRLHIHLSALGTEEPVPSTALEHLIQKSVADVPDNVSESLKSYLKSIVGRALLYGHGALLAVIRNGHPIPPSFANDGVSLVEPIELAKYVETFIQCRSLESASALTAYGGLLEGMLSSDGITILRSDAAIIGYNFFIKQIANNEIPASQLIGGARRRAFESLCSCVNSGDLMCAFIRSSNGSSDCRIGEQV